MSSFIWLALVGESLAVTPDDPGPAAIQFTLNSGQDVKAISPYIYGMNFFAGSTLTNPVTLDRLGGNRWTGYNWETNASNAGSDFQHFSDNYLVGFQSNTPPGEAVRPSLESAASNDRALIVTVPIAGYVSADTSGAVTQAQTAPSSRWHEVVAEKATKYPAEPLTSTPNESDGYVFTDEFVNWVETTKAPGQSVFYSLDNEPALWNQTHARLHPSQPMFQELKAKTIAHAAAIKNVNPNALVFGGVGYGWMDFVQLQDAPDRTTSPAHPAGDGPGGELHFYEWLLQQVAAEEASQERALMDVLDLHWYPEAQGGGVRIIENNNSAAVVAARVQAPRSLWDPTYTETSWITSCCSGGPLQLLNRVRRDVDDFKPGTKLAITEYNYGGTNHISGGIAQADVLGIFGREELFAATFWSLHGDSQSQFASGAFKMYLDYDGAGGEFGDMSVDADTTNIANSAVYASVDSTDPNRMVVVAINRTGSAQTTGIAVTHDRVFDHAEVYQLTSASANPVQSADIELDLLNAFQYTMPAYSVTTLVLISDGLPGDFNRDGLVDAADFTVWRDSLGQTGNTVADANEDNIVDDKDYTLWKSNFGRSESAGAGALATVPEPTSIAIALFAACVLAHFRRRK